MDAALASRSRFLYTLLVQVRAGKGGFEAWRQLEAEYSPAVPTRTVALLVGLLSPKWDPARPFME
eukprot:4944540-Heterocapsa_arctica.AAC.1